MATSPTRPALARGAARSDETREALLAAAHDLLATEGPAGLSVRRIATAAGMSTMNVYSRFGGKDGVLEELFVDGFRRLADTMERAGTTSDPVADLRGCGACYLRFARRNPTYYALMFDRAGPEFVPSPAAVEQALATLRMLAARVQRAMDADALRPGDALEAATALWATVHGLASLAARSPDPPGDGSDWGAVAELAIDAFLRGLAVDA